MRVLIAPEKFKGSLSAAQAAAALAEAGATAGQWTNPWRSNVFQWLTAAMAAGSRSPSAIPSVGSWKVVTL
jgi:hypothetical protein